MKMLLILIFIFPHCIWEGKQAELKNRKGKINISYIRNMGILVHNENTAVLIDGLHEYYGPEYLNTPDTILKKIMNVTPPFEKLQIALFIHHHKDHYSVRLGKEFLQSSQLLRIGGSPQVIDSLTQNQVYNTIDKNGLFFADSVSGLMLNAYNIPHTWPQQHSGVQNIGYLLKYEGISIVHIGDANVGQTEHFHSDLQNVDVLVVPVWFLMESQGGRFISEKIKPKKVIATHISPDANQNWPKYNIKGIDCFYFTEIGASVIVN